MVKKLVVIGANEFQKKIIEKAKKMGYETHVFAWEDGAVSREIADNFYPISILEKEEILSVVKDIQPDGICSIGSDLAMPTVNYIADRLQLIGNTLECTNVTTNKFEMRKALCNKGLPCPKYHLIHNVNDINFSDYKLPLIIKPVDRSGSRGVFKVNDLNVLDIVIERSKAVSFCDKVLVEEYIDGKEYSVEFISQNRKHFFLQITEKFTTGEPNFIEKGHLAPARLSGKYKKDIIKIIENALDALNIENGASHSEVKITPDGVIKIIEIAGRMGGDFIGSDMVYISTGYDFLKNTINVAMKNNIENKNYKNACVAAFVGFLFDENDLGRFEYIKKTYPQIISEYYVKRKFAYVSDSSTRNGYYILKINNSDILKNILNILGVEEKC